MSLATEPIWRSLFIPEYFDDDHKLIGYPIARIATRVYGCL